MPSQTEWHRWARCLTESPEIFFPVGQGPAAQQQARQAKRICARCRVRESCLEWALETEATHGVFGGLDELERNHLARELRTA